MRKRQTSFVLIAAAAAIVWAAGIVLAAQPVPAKGDKCPVCGMFVAKYPDWVASITFGDGQTVFFDGVKDMFKFVFNLKKYRADKEPNDIGDIHVTEYYGASSVDGRQAWYVMGSDIYGPMGKELIPFESEDDARQFMADHKGRAILRFEQITPAVAKRLD